MAKALDASGAGQVVVSAQVWQHLAGTGWGSGPVEGGGAGRPSPAGFRLLHWTPDPGSGPGAGCWSDDIDQSGGSSADAGGSGSGGGGYAFAVDQRSGQKPGLEEHASSIAPAHGSTGMLVGGGGGGGDGGIAKGGAASPSGLSPARGTPRQSISRRSSYSGIGRVGPATAAAAAAAAGAAGAAAAAAAAEAAASGQGVQGRLADLTRAVSLDHAPGAGGTGGVTPGGRCARLYCQISLFRFALLLLLLLLLLFLFLLSFVGVCGGVRVGVGVCRCFLFFVQPTRRENFFCFLMFCIIHKYVCIQVVCVDTLRRKYEEQRRIANPKYNRCRVYHMDRMGRAR